MSASPLPDPRQGRVAPARLRLRLRLRLAVLALAVLALAGCGARLAQVPASGQAIGAIRLEGGDGDDARAVVPGLGLSYARDHGQPYARFLVTQDQRRITNHYVRHGYFAAEVAAAIARRGAAVDVTFTVQRGARARLARVDVLGLPPADAALAARLRARIPIADGAPFEYARWDAAGPTLPALLRDLGYARATVAGLVLADRARAEAVIRLTVTLGPRARFGAIDVRGVPSGLEGAVAARLRVRAGASYRPAALEATRAALYELGRFARVRVEAAPAADAAVVPVQVEVEPAARHDLRLGGGVGLNTLALDLHGLAQYGVAAWPTPMTTTRLELRPALLVQREDRALAPRIEASATVDRLDLPWPRFAGSAQAAFRYQAFEAYAVYGPLVRLGLRSPAWRGVVQASLGWQLELDAFADRSSALSNVERARLGILGGDRIGAFDQSLVVDLRDDRVAPRRGAYVELRAEEGTAAAGSARAFVRLMPDVRGYVSAGWATLALRARAGALFGDAPATRRFFGGGANDQRGLPERQLAPFATTVSGTQVPYGGLAQATASAELRLAVPGMPGRVGLVAFLDGGDVTEAWDALALDHLHWAAGVGGRFPTVIGAVRFDVGWRLNRYGAGEPQAGDRRAFHLTIGEAF